MNKRILAFCLAGSMMAGMAVPFYGGEASDTGDDSSLGGLVSELGSLFGDGGEVSSLFEEGGAVSSLFEEGGAVNELFGENGALSQYLPEGVDLNDLADVLQQKAGEVNSGIAESLNSIVDAVTDEEGNLDKEKLEQSADFLLGMLGLSEDMGSFDDMDAMLQRYGQIYDTIEQYVKAENAAFMEDGDENLLMMPAFLRNEKEDGSVWYVANFCQENFTAQGTNLVLKCASSVTAQVAVEEKEDGSFEVVSFKPILDENNFEAELQAMCEEAGIDFDDYMRDLPMAAGMRYMDMQTFLDEHPEYDRIECDGEMCTAEELGNMSTEEFRKALGTEGVAEGETEIDIDLDFGEDLDFSEDMGSGEDLEEPES